jgi:hypothetical protein
MTQTTASPGDGQTAAWMRGIAAGLHAAGLDARVHDTRGVLDLTATLGRPGGKEINVVVDEDGYVELRYWSAPGHTPAQVTTTIGRALAAITTPP